MRRVTISRLSLPMFVVLLAAPAATAQSLGAFSWQMAPYCNVLTLNVTQNGGVYTLDGFDAQCGDARRAPVTGLATFNPNGTIGLGLTIVNTPDGEPTHVDAAIDLATLGGSWSGGGSIGTFVYNGAGVGERRPTGQLLITKFGNTSYLLGRRVGGTPAAPTPVLGGQNLLLIGGQGYDGRAFGFVSARIVLVASESWQTDAHGSRIQFMTTENGAFSSVVRMTVDHDGQVGIGTDSPGDLLDVNGDVRVGTSGTNGCLRSNNGGALAGACASDARFKRDVVPYAGVLARVGMLRPVQFSWRTEAFPERAFGGARETGLIAQDVEQAFPDLVSTDASGYKAVDYSKLPLIALQAIRELKVQNDALQAENAALARRLAAIEATLKER